mgnify:CR=1 FL=1|tara:strand:- start:952 stop:1299 length:348 start_codon:yes stop_codon:yes gene_type:complete
MSDIDNQEEQDQQRQSRMQGLKQRINKTVSNIGNSLKTNLEHAAMLRAGLVPSGASLSTASHAVGVFRDHIRDAAGVGGKNKSKRRRIIINKRTKRRNKRTKRKRKRKNKRTKRR